MLNVQEIMFYLTKIARVLEDMPAAVSMPSTVCRAHLRRIKRSDSLYTAAEEIVPRHEFCRGKHQNTDEEAKSSNFQNGQHLQTSLHTTRSCSAFNAGHIHNPQK